jgi:hypothetical protein
VAHNTWLQPGPICARLPQVKVAPQLPVDAGGQSSGRGVAPFAGQNLMLPSINRAGAPDRACRVTQTTGLLFPHAGLTLPMKMSAGGETMLGGCGGSGARPRPGGTGGGLSLSETPSRALLRSSLVANSPKSAFGRQLPYFGCKLGQIVFGRKLL